MDPVSIAILFGLSVLVIDRFFNWANAFDKSNCRAKCMKGFPNQD